MSLFPEIAPLPSPTTFRDNLRLPIHRWFRYSAGFSADWVRDLLKKAKAEGRTSVFDPFAGSGTVLIESELAGMQSLGSDSHPFISRVAQAKLSWQVDPDDFWTDYLEFIEQVCQERNDEISHYPEIIQRSYSNETLRRLEKIRVILSKRQISSPQDRLIWLAVVAILRSTSSVATAQWQYLLPNKVKSRTLEPLTALQSIGSVICTDIQQTRRSLNQQEKIASKATFMYNDIRDLDKFPQSVAELVVTSPPYANNYDYADATRLEMTFLKEIRGWSDLQNSVRPNLIRACTQHVAKDESKTFDVIADPVLKPISKELECVCRELENKRHNYGGKKQYHTMLAYYFLDMTRALKTIRHVSVPGAQVCMVIGDSAPYGVYVPVDKWLGELALSVGFTGYRFEKVRDRNVKWKNRKHTVPLKEGYLWIEG